MSLNPLTVVVTTTSAPSTTPSPSPKKSSHLSSFSVTFGDKSDKNSLLKRFNVTRPAKVFHFIYTGWAISLLPCFFSTSVWVSIDFVSVVLCAICAEQKKQLSFFRWRLFLCFTLSFYILFSLVVPHICRKTHLLFFIFCVKNCAMVSSHSLMYLAQNA